MAVIDEAFEWSEVLGPLSRREDIPSGLIEAAMATILSGAATEGQIAAFAVLLRAKGETPVELATLVRTMLTFAEPVAIEPESAAGPLVDTCGTGGDRSHTFNISTVAALVVAGAGVRVAKHGNRAASSACGSADLLEELGVVIDLGPDGVVRCIDETNIAFCFAQKFHPAMRYAGPVRKQLGVPTTFNFLGPLANPARVTRQVVGVSDPGMADRVIGTLRELGAHHAMVFFGHDGLDELTITDVSTVRELRDGELHRYVLDPLDLGVARAGAADLRGGNPAHNAAIARRVLDGEKGAIRDVVLLNAAAALVVADAADDLAAGFELAGAAIDDGRAAATLDKFIASSQAARDAEAG
jgi:anthranilate phosphoribosyltransferase